MEAAAVYKTEDTAQAELETLLLRVGQGDREALGSLYAAAKGAVYAMALSCLRDADEAQDVTQDVFVRVWTCAGQYRPMGRPMAWLLTMTRNLARMRLRARPPRQELTGGQWQAIPADRNVSPEDRLVLQSALGVLGDTERQIVLLHAAAGLRHREIGELMDMPLATVLSKYHRALKKMREQLKGGEDL